MIDTHCHPDLFVRRGCFDAILERAEAAGVVQMICAGTEPEDWKTYRELSQKFPQKVFYTVGLHPGCASEDWAKQLEGIEDFFSQGARGGTPSPVWGEGRGEAIAVGEIGLDEYRMPKEPEVAAKVRDIQRAVFARQLELAKKLGVPVVVHARNAFDAAVKMIDESGVAWENVVFHCFSEDAELVKNGGVSLRSVLNERGGKASFTGTVTYKNAQTTREAALAQGLENLMIETDCPYLAPCKLRGKENEPSYLRETAKFLAELFGVSLEELDRITTENARKFYRLPSL